ncbi:MAG: hypothetical protein M5U09_19285 [Gammaproteobacteria bacterium]|nr:hypothetical protein [Gammaproteobacteria bacterium]
MNRLRWLAAAVLTTAVLAGPGDDPGRGARAAADQAIDYFRANCAQAGGALWWYTTDLKTQAGEGGTQPKSVVWVQFPGTPAVGDVYPAALRRHRRAEVPRLRHRGGRGAGLGAARLRRLGLPYRFRSREQQTVALPPGR